MSDESRVSDRCTWCGGPLPAPIEILSVVRGSDGATMPTCRVECLAELVSALAGRNRQPVTGRSN